MPRHWRGQLDPRQWRGQSCPHHPPNVICATGVGKPVRTMGAYLVITRADELVRSGGSYFIQFPQVVLEYFSQRDSSQRGGLYADTWELPEWGWRLLSVMCEVSLHAVYVA